MHVHARLFFRLRESMLKCRGFGDETMVAAMLTMPYVWRAYPRTGGSFSWGPARQQRNASSSYLVSGDSAFALDGRAAHVGTTAEGCDFASLRPGLQCSQRQLRYFGDTWLPWGYRSLLSF